ncbi:MAG: homoserine dehydrogenase [Verrucomicrobia bacterium]|jgi:homoserine dehydrogenase|nr:homoserine dehydrogenase [Verrucomicrobiota bacterium]
MSPRRNLNLAFAGLGTVGQGVWRHLSERSAELQARMGIAFTLYKAAVRDPSKTRDPSIPAERLTTNAMALAEDPEVDVLCELMGGTEEALAVTRTALERGKTVVTANKALLCHHGEELFRLARDKGAHIYFEASVAGGIPIIKALREGLVVNRFPLIYGILNGTCNYILTRMEREGQPFEAIVGDARRLGYVEADEALDLDGLDAAHKTAIVAYLAHGKWIPLEEMPVEGIRGVRLEDIQWAQSLGYKIKLLAVILRDFEGGSVFSSVQPMLVPRERMLANVDGVFNAISVTGDVVGESIYIGRGAGQDATASAVISDIVDAGTALANEILPEEPAQQTELRTSTPEQVIRSFYMRMSVRDQPGVLAEVATVLTRQNISIESVLQRPNGDRGAAHLVLTTHMSSEAAMTRAVAELEGLEALLDRPFLLRIADFAQHLG